MKKFIKVLSIIAAVLGALAVINGIICLIIITVNMFQAANLTWYMVDQLFFIFEIYLVFAGISVSVLLQSIWIYHQIISKKPVSRSARTYQK